MKKKKEIRRKSEMTRKREERNGNRRKKGGKEWKFIMGSVENKEKGNAREIKMGLKKEETNNVKRGNTRKKMEVDFINNSK